MLKIVSGSGFMRFSKTNTLLLLAVQALFSGMLVAQNIAAPIYATDPHPAQVPNAEQDRAPEGMNKNTGQNDMPVFRVTVSERTTKAVSYRNLEVRRRWTSGARI
jgi:hypothetical protein